MANLVKVIHIGPRGAKGETGASGSTGPSGSIPTGTVSSSAQFNTITNPFTGSFSGSFTGDGSGLIGLPLEAQWTASGQNIYYDKGKVMVGSPNISNYTFDISSSVYQAFRVYANDAPLEYEMQFDGQNFYHNAFTDTNAAAEPRWTFQRSRGSLNNPYSSSIGDKSLQITISSWRSASLWYEPSFYIRSFIQARTTNYYDRNDLNFYVRTADNEGGALELALGIDEDGKVSAGNANFTGSFTGSFVGTLGTFNANVIPYANSSGILSSSANFVVSIVSRSIIAGGSSGLTQMGRFSPASFADNHISTDGTNWNIINPKNIITAVVNSSAQWIPEVVSNNPSHNINFLPYRHRGTKGAPGFLSSSDQIFNLEPTTYDGTGTAWKSLAALGFSADGDHSTSSFGIKLALRMIPEGGTSKNSIYTYLGSGKYTLHQYGSKTFTGSRAYGLFVDSAGTVIESNDYTGSFSGSFAGTLTLPTFTDTSLLFVTSSGLIAQDNANLRYDDNLKSLRVGPTTNLSGFRLAFEDEANTIIVGNAEDTRYGVIRQGNFYSVNSAGGAVFVGETIGGATGFFGFRANGTTGSKTAVVEDDIMFTIQVSGYDSSSFSTSGDLIRAFEVVATENFTSSAQGRKVKIRTVGNGTVTGIDHTTFEDAGKLRLHYYTQSASPYYNIPLFGWDGTLEYNSGSNKTFSYSPSSGFIKTQLNANQAGFYGTQLQMLDYGAAGSSREIEMFKGCGTIAARQGASGSTTIGSIAFTMVNSNAALGRFSTGFSGRIIDPTDGIETSQMWFWTSNVGTSTGVPWTKNALILAEDQQIRFPQYVSSSFTASGEYGLHVDSQGFVVRSNDYTGSFTGSFAGNLKRKTTRITSATYTVSETDFRIGIKYTLTGSVNIQLPLILDVPNQEYRFKDEEGNAATNNIHILASGSNLIDGAATASLKTNYAGFLLYNDLNNNWFIE